MALTADALIADPPRLHGASAEGELHQWTLGPQALAILDRLLHPGLRTLETGAGASTVMFALHQTSHTCIVPSTEEIERIQAYCAANDVPIDTVTFIPEISEEALPRLGKDPLDLALIDGSHSFPSVFIDFYYTTTRMGAGSWLFIDDTHLWTGRTLRNFLLMDEGWTLEEDFHFRTSIFRKHSPDRKIPNWIYQRYVVAHSSFTPGQRTLTMLRERDWRVLGDKVTHRLGRALRRKSE